MALNSLLSEEDRKSLSETSIQKKGRFGNIEYRRSQAELKKYNKMLELEKNQEALSRIQTKDFQDVLKRYYKNRPQFLKDGTFLENKHFDMMSSTELLHYFYNDRTWRNNNTIALSRDVYDLGTGTDQDLSDWAIINQTYIDLPNFWNDPNRTFYSWAKDFIPALVADPINLVGFGVGGVAARQTIKESVKFGAKKLTKNELSKLAIKKGLVQGAKYEAVVGGSVAAGFDSLQQSNEITAGLADEWNWKRTMIAGGIGIGAGGTLGAGFGAFGSKRAMGKYYKHIDGDVVDVLHLGKTMDNKQVIASKIDDGYIVDKNGKVKKSKGTKDKKIKKSDTVEIKPDETPFISKQANKANREVDEFFNEKTIKGKTAIDTLKNIFRTVLKKKDKGFRLERRDIKEVLSHIEKKAKIKISNSSRKQILDEADAINQVGTGIGTNWVALRILQLKEVSRLRKMQEILDGASTNSEKILAEANVDKAWVKWAEVSSKLDKLRTNISDNLQAGKIRIDADQAKSLTIKYTDTVRRILDDYKAKGVDIDTRRQIKRNLLRNLSNENRMNKIIQKADMTSVEGRATFGDWLNEYTTANLLFDATTHMINILSGMVKFQWNMIQDYSRSLIMMPSHRKMAIQQMRMANDMFIGQFQFFLMALRKAGRSFTQGRALGDQIQHKIDTRKWRAMDAYTNQLNKEIGLMSEKVITQPMSWLSKLVYLSYRGLQAGDTFMKQAFNRAARAAHVNHRMRVSRPDLWSGKKSLTPKVNAVKEDQLVKHIEELIRWEQGKPKVNNKRIAKYEAKKNKLLEIISEKDKDEFTRVWKEWFNQYEDEFGNFRGVREMSKDVVKNFDDLTKSIIFDPQFRAREATFTNSLRSDIVPDAIDPLMKNNDGFAGALIRAANNHPMLRVLAGLHFLKVPAHLNRFAWWHTPFLNKLHFQFRAMEKSADPIIRSHAKSIQATSVALFGIATSLAFQGRLHGGLHPDPKKKNSIQLTINGKEEYVQFQRLYPLSVPFMAVASFNDMIRGLPDIWNDKTHQEASDKFSELAVFIGKSTMALMANVFSANLMTSEMFTKMETLFDGTLGYSEASTDNWASEFSRTWLKDLSKLVPAATGNRWANKELADADAELKGVFDKILFSTPVELFKLLGIPYHHFQPKRDPNGNILPKVKGVGILGITNLDTPFKVSSAWINSILDTEEGRHLFESMGIVYKPPMGIVTKHNRKLGDMRKFIVKSYIDYNSRQVMNDGDYILDADGKAMIDVNTGEKRIFKAGQQTFYDLMMEVKSTMRIDGLTLNERLKTMFDNPQSPFMKSVRWEQDKSGRFIYDGSNVAGNNPEAKRVLEIIRIYEQAAKDWVLYKTYNGDEISEFPIFYEKELKLADVLLVTASEYKEVSEQRIKYLNALTNGN